MALIAAIHHEMRARHAQRRSRDRIRQPVHVIAHPQIRGSARNAVAERAAYPAIAVIAGFGEYGADCERDRRMQRRKRIAAGEPGIRIGSFVGPLAPDSVFLYGDRKSVV